MTESTRRMMVLVPAEEFRRHQVDSPSGDRAAPVHRRQAAIRYLQGMPEQAPSIDTEIMRIRMLELLYDFPSARYGERARVVNLLSEDIGLDDHQQEVWWEVLEDLHRERLIHLADVTGFESLTAVITDSGRSDVESRRTRRADPVRRGATARDGVIRWLFAQPGHRASRFRPFLAPDDLPLHEGAGLNLQDLLDAISYLHRRGLVAGSGGYRMPPPPSPFQASDDPRVLRPIPRARASRRLGVVEELLDPLRLTEQGEDCFEHYGGSVSAYLRRNEPVAGVVNNVNIGTVTGDGKVFWANRDVTQTVNTTTGVAGDELVSLVRAIRQALPVLELDQADADRVRSQLDVLEGELGTDQPDEGVVRSVLQRALGKLGDVTGNSLGLLLTAYGRHLMQQAGILPE